MREPGASLVLAGGPSPVTVSAAASLTAAFQSLGSAVGQVNPPLLAEYNFAGSPTLVAQIQQGRARRRVASADQPNMQKLVDGGLVIGSRGVRYQRLQIVWRPESEGHHGAGGPGSPGPGGRPVGPAVPCGRYATQALQKAARPRRPCQPETDVKAVVSKVALGEADAGIVYVTDIKAGGATVQGIAIPDHQNVVATYPIAVVKAASPAGGAGLCRFRLSAQGQRILASSVSAVP